MLMRSCLLVAAATVLVAVPVIGQNSERPSEVHFRNQCRLAAQVIETGHPAGRKAWALDWIGNCDQDGPPVLATLWSRPALDSADVERVLDASGRIRDQRLADAASSIAGDENAPDHIRVAALILLVRYADTYTGLSPADLRVPAGWVPGRHVRPIVGGHGSHRIPQVDGGTPLPAAFAAESIERLQAVAESTTSLRVRYAAEALVARIKLQVAQGEIQ
jgi:hypothetical protein